MKFLCEQCKAKYQIADEKVAGKTVRMKCRKCGYLIEVRAALAESSGPAAAPAAPSEPLATATGIAPRPAAKPAQPRPTSLSVSLSAQKATAPKPDRLPSALAGAFKSNVQREEEVSAPFDMSEISPGDDWYVAVNGVPVGPVRTAEVRRKAVLGAVTEDSLVWQEGLDEWRPLRSFPELAAIVRDALSGNRTSSTPPPPDGRANVTAPTRTASSRPHAPAAQRAVVARNQAAAAPRSNVVAISSRLATAEKLEEPSPAPAALAKPLAAPSPDPRPLAAVSDPFGASSQEPSVASRPLAPESATAVRGSAASLPPAQKSTPWIVVAMVVAAGAFGITVAVGVVLPLLLPKPQVAPTLAQAPTPSAAPTASAAALATASAVAPSAADVPPPAVAASPTVRANPVGNPAKAAAPAAATGNGRTLDLSGIGRGPSVGLNDESANESPKGAGNCLSEGQVQQVIGLHQVAIRRACWERNGTAKPTANISVALTVAADGSAQNVSASGDEPSVAKCIENDVRGWHFPAMGCTQKTAIPFKFVRQ